MSFSISSSTTVGGWKGGDIESADQMMPIDESEWPRQKLKVNENIRRFMDIFNNYVIEYYWATTHITNKPLNHATLVTIVRMLQLVTNNKYYT